MTTKRSINEHLARIMSPDIAEDVARAYASLAERAKTAEFGLLEEDVVVVDTETTGLDFKDCELIEVSAARLRGRDIVDKFDMLVHPEQPIPSEVVSITGITNEMVQNAPSAAHVCKEFAVFVDDAPIIAHNAMFDRHFITKGNNGTCIGQTWVDSLELSRIVLPCLTSHKLHDLSRAFDLHSSTHRALDDVLATCGLWRILLTAASDLPPSLIELLSDFYPNVAWSYRPIFTQLAALQPGTPFSLLDIRSQRCAAISIEPRPDAHDLEEEAPLDFPTQEEIQQAFDSGGIIEGMYEPYEPRAAQKQMACAVGATFKSKEKRAIEAGTGVGKSMAYLLPAALFAQRNGICVGVATKSNALADQLLNKEIPALSLALDSKLEYATLKGYDNYPCMRKVARLVREGRPSSHTEGDTSQQEIREDLLNALAAILSYATQSALGDINRLGIRWGKLQRSDFTCRSSECQKTRCPFFHGTCFLHLARRRAAACDVVVTNHSLLFNQVASKVEVLPPIRYWIVDEAHGVETEARRQFALVINTRELAAAFDVCGGSTTGALGNVLRAVSGHAAATFMMGLLTKTASECARAQIAAGLFFEDLKKFCRAATKGRRSKYDTETIWIDASTRASEPFRAVAESGASLRDTLAKAVRTGNDAAREISAQDNVSSDVIARLSELTRALAALNDAAVALDTCLKGDDDTYVYSAASNQRSGFETYELSAEPLDVGDRLAKDWYPEISSVVYSSATIAVGDTFEHFGRGVGLHLPKGSSLGVRLPSGYDFDSLMRVVVVEGLPDPSRQKEEYLARLAPLLVDTHITLGGSVLTLFTSRAEMDHVYQDVQPEVARQGLELAAQHRGENVLRLREHFVAEKSSSLFALRSFWEGIDAKGDTLRCVVMPRLPFTPPTDPLSQKRREVEGKDAWRNHDLPEAVIAFKQAVGRLIRSSTDTGILVLLDPRLSTMWYGRIFLHSLPTNTQVHIPYTELRETLRTLRKSLEQSL